ncbi:MAG: glycosyltransferase [Candidatus Bathyarchaeota archaeon]|nr:glycosyltransferase [Candidatus Bathyarchaeota archaeon]
MAYITVTPVRNEQDYLPDLFQCMINQTIKPLVWVIVDDQSADSTWMIIDNLQQNFSWIKGIKSDCKVNIGYAHERVTQSTKRGIDYAITMCYKNNFEYDFISVIDADVILENRYFEKIFEVFRKDNRLGIASGMVYEPKLSLQQNLNMNSVPRGCALVFRKKCYEAIAGYHGHSNSLLKANNRKWITKTVSSIKVVHRRETGYNVKYFLAKGDYAHYINLHPLMALLMSVYFSKIYSPRKGLLYLIGYIKSFILKKQQIDDDEIKECYWRSLNRALYRFNSLSSKNN